MEEKNIIENKPPKEEKSVKKKVVRIRKARKQLDRNEINVQRDETSMGEYNIWYHKTIGQKKDETYTKSKTRCNVLKDSGWTKGCSKEDPFFCRFFAGGKCFNGEKCTGLHRIPVMSDELRIPLTKDCFGREKFASDRDDMGGVGSFSREGKTIFVQGLKNIKGVDMNEVIIRHFQEWGELAYVNYDSNNCTAYVKYKNRLNAEFAKEAMIYQSLDNNEVLKITWADDSVIIENNPMEKTRMLMESRRKLVESIEKTKKKDEKKDNKPEMVKDSNSNDLSQNPLFKKIYEQTYLKYMQEHNNDNKKEKKDLSYEKYLHDEFKLNAELEKKKDMEIEENNRKRKRVLEENENSKNSKVIDVYNSEIKKKETKPEKEEKEKIEEESLIEIEEEVEEPPKKRSKKEEEEGTE